MTAPLETLWSVKKAFLTDTVLQSWRAFVLPVPFYFLLILGYHRSEKELCEKQAEIQYFSVQFQFPDHCGKKGRKPSIGLNVAFIFREVGSHRGYAPPPK